MKKITRKEFEKEYNYCDIHSETCIKCGKKYLFGGLGTYDEYFFDIKKEEIATFYENESGSEETHNLEWCRVHICDCGVVLFVQMNTVFVDGPTGIEQTFITRSK